MKYKVIVTDYDGTYIKNDKSVSPSQLKAVKDFISRGGYFIVCTGRMTSGIDHFLLKDGFNGYLASFNGGEIVNLKTGEVLYKNQIDNATCVEITEYAKEHNINIYGYPNRSFITEKEDEKTEFYKKMTGVDYQKVESVSGYFKISKNKSSKLLFFDSKEKLDEHFDEIYEKFSHKVEVIRSNAVQIDVNAKGVSKGEAVKKISQLINVPISQIICVGDSGNDIPMLLAGGVPIAVGNALKEVKEICKHVVCDNENDAIKQVIENFCI